MKRDVWQFLEDDKVLSASRLAYLGSFIAASAIMGIMVVKGEMTEGYFWAYIGTYTGGYVGGKMAGRGQHVVSKRNKLD